VSAHYPDRRLGSAYRPRIGEDTVLYRVLQEHLDTFLERAQVDGRGLPTFVERELRGFLRCRVKAAGFLRVYCPTCREEYALPLSCKGRGFCPSCCGRFMAETAFHLVDHVLRSDLPYRHWALTLPYPLRYRAAYEPRVQNVVLRALVATLDGWYRRRAREAGVKEPCWGALTALQRTGSALQLTPHSHSVGFDGVFAVDRRGHYARFRPLPEPSQEDVQALVMAVADRALDSLVRKGLYQPQDDSDAADPLALDQPAQAACYAASIQSRIAFGPEAGRRLPRQGSEARATAPRTLPRLCAEGRGFNLHGGVAVAAGDERGLLRLVKYLTRPPLAHNRLSLSADGRIAYELKRPFADGSEQVLFTPDAFLAHLAAMVYRPRFHRLRYHGIIAPAARHRRLVVPKARGTPPESPPLPGGPPPAPPADDSAPKQPASPGHTAAPPRTRSWAKTLWAELLKRTFDVDPLACQCGGRMRPIALILRAEDVQAILRAQGLPAEAPRIRPCRDPPDGDLLEVRWD
jgi:hypothetical protein